MSHADTDIGWAGAHRIQRTSERRSPEHVTAWRGRGNRKITVMPGAKLTVDGGSLTNTCGNNWQGVEVLGTPNVAPSTALGGPHGVVTLKNGATIEHAKEGVASINGGIVRSNGNPTNGRITFRNCRKGVVLKPYSYPGTQVTGSLLTNTDFICDAPMNDPSYVSNGQRVGVNEFVSAYLHDRVRITACTFTNTIDYEEHGEPGTFTPPVRGIGIIAIDTKMDISNSTFTGLYRGVDVARTLLSSTATTVTGSEFVNTMQAITSSGSSFDRVHGNQFFMPDGYWGESFDVPEVEAWGVFMVRGFGHRVTFNDFFPTGEEMTLSRGFVNRGLDITVLPSGGLLRKNTFNNIFVGTQTELHNLHLQMRCNTYQTDMLIDWAINPQSPNGILGPQGTGCVEENPSHYRAGNVFLNEEDHILSWAQPFQYFYPDIAGQIPTYVGGFAEQPCFSITSGDPSCDEPTSPGPVVLDDRKRALDADIAQLKAERLALIDDLDSLGTKTATLLGLIADTTYSNSTLTTKLLQWSLLSDTVLKAASLRHPFFTDQQFKDIIITNSPVTREVWPYVMDADLDLKVSLAAIIAAQRTDTVRTVRVIEREREVGETERFQVAMDYLDIFMDRDTIPDSTYTAIHYMVDSLAAREWIKLAVGTAFSLDTLTLTRTLLENLILSDTEDTAFYRLHDLAIVLREDTLTWFDMDSTQYALIVNLADGETLMKTQAQTILALLADTAIAYWPEPIPEEPSLKLSEEEDDETAVPMSEERMDEHVKVYPNPFQNAFTVQYSFPEEVQELRFELFDLTGRKLLEEAVMNTTSGSSLLNLAHCKGLYLLRVTADGRRVRSEKLLCIER